jgi:hypothetical protein
MNSFQVIRYCEIVSDPDLKMAAAKQSADLDSLRGHNLGTICPYPEKKEESRNG